MTRSTSNPSRTDLQALSESRLKEAEVLLANDLPDGAVYLAGYALELAFKARICKLLDTDYPPRNFNSFFTHKYLELVLLAGLEKQLAQKQSDTAFNASWSVLIGGTTREGWSENWRYRKIGSISMLDAQDFIKALNDAQSGILIWLKTVW